jgi:uncharacterized membrane protein
MNRTEPNIHVSEPTGASSNGLLIASTAAAVITLLPVAAHQLGLIKHLPDPPSRIFDSDRITGSKSAHPFGVPDSLLGLGSYGVTLALALMAPECRCARRVLALKLAADGSLAGFNVVKQIVSFRRLCSWCTGTALCTLAMVVAGCSVTRPAHLAVRAMPTTQCSEDVC